MWSNRTTVILLVLLTVGFVYGIVELYDLRLSEGDIYPIYSSLRADPLGTELLHDSLREVSGYKVTRNFEPVEAMKAAGAAVLFIGVDPYSFVLTPEDDLKHLETLAARGNRIIFAFRPVKRVLANDKKANLNTEALEKRWGVSFDILTRGANDGDDEGPLPKVTALVIREDGRQRRVLTKRFGAGEVVLFGNAYELSNESLAAKESLPRVFELIGERQDIVFDESHLGLKEQASVAMLMRKYRLGGLILGLFILAALFIWRNSSTLLPARSQPPVIESGSADSNRALVSLLRRHIKPEDVIRTCVAEWERSGHGGRYYSEDKLKRVRELGAGTADAAEVYRRMAYILSERK
ncbi:MAG TPA: DUF4350 domain-containing protein [Bryobacteraceae bacterium]|nr:DUF4350 domain-containing protein [Bryobacteraceae bacterium]